MKNICRGLFSLILLFLLTDVHPAAGQGLPVTQNQYPLNSWSIYDTNTWASDYGYTPVAYTNLGFSISGDYGSLVVDSTNAVFLKYNVYESDGTTNLTVDKGSVTLWFSPSWAGLNAGGSGPGGWGQLIGAGQWTTNATYGWWSLYTDAAGTNLYFSAQNNAGSQANYIAAPIAWTPGQWHFIALTYSSTNTALYLDGQLATTGMGMTVWPSSTVLANGFNVGSDTNGLWQAHGKFDDIYTYNFVLDSNTISSTFSLFKPAYYLLDSWSFYDTAGWTNDFGYAPLSFTNLDVTLGDGYALLLDTNTAAWLQYKGFESDGRTNLTFNQGSVTMWFAPTWSSVNHFGTGPVAWGQLIGAGQYTSDASYGWFSLYVDSGGTNLLFSAQSNDGLQTNYLTFPISWTALQWHFITLTYSATNTALYLDGKLATNGVGMSVWPPSNVLSNGIYFGSDTNGAAQARGIMDDVATYSIPLDAGAVSNLFAAESLPYILNPFTTFNNGIISGLGLPSPLVYQAITGIGSLQSIGLASSCYSGTNIWITNVVATMTSSGTNATMNVTFTIEGGSNAVPYDVFANSVLSFGTNGASWSWMGQGYQCNVYTLTNLPLTACFLILGTPKDSDSDGLTDAYEKLCSHTDPNNPDTDGDGLSDAWEVLLGTNPNFSDNATTASRLNYTYNFSDWLEGVSGKKTGSVSLDNEGNVLSVSQ